MQSSHWTLRIICGVALVSTLGCYSYYPSGYGPGTYPGYYGAPAGGSVMPGQTFPPQYPSNIQPGGTTISPTPAGPSLGPGTGSNGDPGPYFGNPSFTEDEDDFGSGSTFDNDPVPDPQNFDNNNDIFNNNSTSFEQDADEEDSFGNSAERFDVDPNQRAPRPLPNSTASNPIPQPDDFGQAGWSEDENVGSNADPWPQGNSQFDTAETAPNGAVPDPIGQEPYDDFGNGDQFETPINKGLDTDPSQNPFPSQDPTAPFESDKGSDSFESDWETDTSSLDSAGPFQQPLRIEQPVTQLDRRPVRMSTRSYNR